MEKVLPLQYLISFDKYLRTYDQLAAGGPGFQREKARYILDAQAPYPELRQGFTEVEKLHQYGEVLQVILQDAFSSVLGENEIKALTLPYHNILFNPSARLERILQEAGEGFSPDLRHREEGVDYMMACTVILNFYYGYQLDFSRPYFYEIPDAQGVLRHYRVMYNADFLEILPTDTVPEITQQDVDELLQRPNDLELWKSKIPPRSFIVKGFAIANMFDVTNDQSISTIKSKLISSDKRGSDQFMHDLQDTFRSFFRQKDLRVGFITYNAKLDRFERVHGKGIESFILKGLEAEDCSHALCDGSYEKLIAEHQYFVIPDMGRFQCQSKGHPFYTGLYEQGVRSAVFAPIAEGQEMLGVLEIVSGEANALNGVNANKLDDVMPYIVSAVQRSKIEEENLIDAIIQHECTTVHDSVLWKFQEEAKRFIIDQLEGREPGFREISFDQVYPLYGQTDIKDSSRARNEAIQRDLMIQLTRVRQVVSQALEHEPIPVYEELVFRLDRYLKEVGEVLHTNTEQMVYNFIHEEVNPVLEHVQGLNPDLEKAVTEYRAGLDAQTESYYDHRRNYDQSILRINKTMASLLDQRQQDAQAMFPHYFERYKTDGVEHNMYIGDSISADRQFDPLYLNNLRLWQLQVVCEMENAYYNLKPDLPVPLDVTSMILVYHTQLSIRFRMDEKRFDVDGTYNARYEVIKKRIDKSYIKGTRERLTQPGKLAIVYSRKADELEYLRYIAFLRTKGYFTRQVEIVELEGLQGVTGLKAIRAEIAYHRPGAQGEAEKEFYNYDDLMKALEA
ncbi:GAF domain-containing protein [Robiginitalea sp. M366]|uniref:GAF domain-containing protein n=1 Tax=Robiginitalea aestuariiviva TaxID=3036903 RepID=UPI00240D3A1E|nr:GAF domain-containing protein [Robiginitalea aestuariiviva]MDG1571803.1 GAF domain-containing protein [Robiginitalea aestuariiviva]